MEAWRESRNRPGSSSSVAGTSASTPRCGLQKKLRANEASVTVIDPQPHMTYQPFLPEAAAGVHRARGTSSCRCAAILQAAATCVTGARHRHRPRPRRSSPSRPTTGTSSEIGYDMLVVALGSVARLLPIPGLAEHGITFKTIGEAIYLRNHVLVQAGQAASTPDPRRCASGC